MPSGARLSYGHRAFHPIYEAAVAHDLPVAIHPGTEGVGISGSPTAGGYPSSYLEWHTGLVSSYMAHLISLVSDEVFQRFPTLRFVMMEAGALWLPPLLWRFDKNWMGLRQTTPWLDRAPSAIIADHILLGLPGASTTTGRSAASGMAAGVLALRRAGASLRLTAPQKPQSRVAWSSTSEPRRSSRHQPCHAARWRTPTVSAR